MLECHEQDFVCLYCHQGRIEPIHPCCNTTDRPQVLSIHAFYSKILSLKSRGGQLPSNINVIAVLCLANPDPNRDPNNIC